MLKTKEELEDIILDLSGRHTLDSNEVKQLQDAQEELGAIEENIAEARRMLPLQRKAFRNANSK